MTETLRFLVVLELLALAGLPLAARAFGRLPGAGLGLARVLALLVVGWLVWLAGSLGVPNGLALAVGGAIAVAAGAAAAWRLGAAPAPDPFRRRALVAGEAVFVAAFLAGALLMSFQADVWGTEKPMDMMLVNATLAADAFPPHDPWLSGEELNYYYVGQLLLGLLVRLTGVEPTAGYNLAMATVFALGLSTAFTVAATLAEAARREGLAVPRPLVAGAGAAVLLGLAGNLRGGWDALTHVGPDDGFDWFAASRVVEGTINEFPYFSLLVGDLHAHLIAVPLGLLAAAFALQAGLHGPPDVRMRRGAFESACAALAIGVLYAVNAWSWPVAAGLLVLAVVTRATVRAPRRDLLRGVAWAAGVCGAGLVLLAPFVLAFEPNARGVGLVPARSREPLEDFLGHTAVLYGALLWPAAALFGARLTRARHPVRVLVWGGAVLAVVLSLTATARLAGAALLALLAAVALHAAVTGTRAAAERLVWGLVASGLLLVAGPEVAYVRDEFEGGEFERMNTVFKLGYQAWVLLAVAGGVVLAAAGTWLPRAARAGWLVVALALAGVAFAYVPVGAAGRTDAFSDGPRLDGRAWLARTAPGDVAAIDWLRASVPGDAVVLEAVGEDYGQFGNARISTYTGRPTVLGWAGHERQWNHDVGARAEDVRLLYTTRDAEQARVLVALYGVEYAVVGPLERSFYGSPGALTTVGRQVFERDGTAVYAFG